MCLFCSHYWVRFKILGWKIFPLECFDFPSCLLASSLAVGKFNASVVYFLSILKFTSFDSGRFSCIISLRTSTFLASFFFYNTCWHHSTFPELIVFLLSFPSVCLSVCLSLSQSVSLCGPHLSSHL
jgi:hypothetical protein